MSVSFDEMFDKAVNKKTVQPTKAPAKSSAGDTNFDQMFDNGLKKKASTSVPTDQSNTSSSDVNATSTDPTPVNNNDNHFTDQLGTFHMRGRNDAAELKAQADASKQGGKQTALSTAQKNGGLASFKKDTKITAPNGVTLSISPSNSTASPSEYNEMVSTIQKRVDTGQVTPADIQTVATLTKKTPDATAAYLTGDTNKGAAIDNVEEQKALQSDMSNVIAQYNASTGENNQPEEVLSSADKTAQFLQKLKQQKANILTTNLEAQRDQLPNAVENSLATGFDPNSFLNKANEYQELLKQHVVTQTIKEDEKAGVQKEQTLKNIAKRLNPDDYYRTLKANIPVAISPLNPASGAGVIFDKVFGTEEKDELLNSQKGVAELAYNSQQKQMANNEISQGILTNDINLQNVGKARMASTKSNDEILQANPSLLKQKIAQEVSKEIAYRSGQLEGSETDNYKTKIFGANANDIAKTDAMQGYLNDPKTHDLAESMLQTPELFSDASYLGGVKNSFLQPFKELGLSIGDISGFRTNKDVYASNIKDRLFPTETEGTKADLTLPVVGDVRVRHVLNTTANLTGMAVIAAGTEGIGTELGASASVAKSLGAYTSFGLPSYDGALKDSYNFLNNDAARTLYATITAVTNAEGGRVLDLGKLTRIPGVSDAYAKLAEGLTENTLTKKGVNELLDDAKNKYVDFAVKYGKNVTKGAATMAYFNIANNITKIAFGDPNVKTEDVLPQAAHAFTDGVLGMSIMGGFGAYADMKQEKNTTYKGFIYNMALNHDATKDVFDIGLKNGTYTQEQYNEKVSILNASTAAKNAMDAAQSETNTKLDVNQKSVYVANKTAELFLRKKAEADGVTEADAKRYTDQADRLNQQAKDITGGLKFNQTLEPLYDLYNAEKEYDAALSDFNDNKGSEKNLETAKQNYDGLINKYFADKGKQDAATAELAKKPVEEDPAKPVITDEAHKAIEEGIKSGLIPEMTANVLNTDENKAQFLKEVAEQSKGELADGNKAGEGGAQEAATRNTYGNDIVDEALKMYPEKEKANEETNKNEVPNAKESEGAANIEPDKVEPATEEGTAAKKQPTSSGLDKAAAKKVYEETRRIDEPSDARGLALAYLAHGGKVSEDAINEVSGTVKRASLNTGARELKSNEARERDYSDKKADGIDKIVHRIWDGLPENLQNKIDIQDIKNELQSAIKDHTSRLDAAKEYIKSYGVEEPPAFADEEQVSDEEKRLTDYLNSESQNDYEIEHISDNETQNIINHVTENERADQQPSTETESGSDKANSQDDSQQKGESVKDISSQTQSNKNGNKESNAESKGSGEIGSKESDGIESSSKGSDGESRKGLRQEQDDVNDEGKPESNDGSGKPSENDDERYVSVRKEKLKEIEGAKELFEKRAKKTWSEVYDSAMKNLQKMYPSKSLYEAMLARINDFTQRLNNKELFNPTSEDIAVFNVFRAETEKRIKDVEGLDSENSIVRQAAIEELKHYNDDLYNIARVTNPEGEAGRAFGMLKSEINIDNGLKIRRMQMMDANGGEKLSPEDEKWAKQKWEEEKDLMKQEADIRNDKMEQEFKDRLDALEKEYQEKLNDGSKNKTPKEKTLSQKGKDVADKIRKLKKPKGSTNIDFTLGTWDLAIEGIAKLVEAGSTVAEAIQKMIDDGVIGFKEDKDKKGFEDLLHDSLYNKIDKADALENIKEFAKDNDVTDITKDMVDNNLIRDYVDSHIGEVDQKDILDTAFNDLKKELPNITKERMIEAYLKENEFRQPSKKDLEGGIAESKKQLKNIAKLTEDIEDLNNLKSIRQRNFPTDRERSDAEKELADKKAAKIKEIRDRRDKIIADNKKIEAERNRQLSKVKDLKDKKAKLERGVREKTARTTKIDTPEIESLKEQVKQADKNLREAEAIARKIVKDAQDKKDKLGEFDANIKRAQDGLEQINTYRKAPEKNIDDDIEAKKKELKKSIEDNSTDEQVQSKKLEQAKKTAEKNIKEFQRRLDENDFEDKAPATLKKQDAELIRLKKQQSRIEEDFRKKQKEIREKNKTGFERAADFARSAYVAILIGAPKTLLKVASMSILRPASEIATKLTFGKVFDTFFPEISKAAKLGGESSSLRSVQAGFEAYFRQMGEKGIERLYEKKEAKFENSKKAYLEYKNSDSPDPKKLEQLKNKMNDALMGSIGTIVYKFIGGSSIKDALGALINRSNEIEKQFGKVEGESIKNGNWLDKTNYVMGFIGRSHSAAKTFSGRFSFAAGFMARLEGAIEKGEDISQPDKMLEIAHESYLDWERGKYQQSNFISDKWNDLINHLEKGETGKGLAYSKIAKYVLQSDVAITRVPVNILHEQIAEYAFGSFRALAKIAKSNKEVREQLKAAGVTEKDVDGLTNEEYRKSFKEQVSQMDEKQAATIARAFRKGGLGVGLYALALISGAIHFGIFPHMGQKKKKDDEDLGKDELNPGQIMVGDTKLGETVSAIAEHVPAFYPTLMGLGMAQSYKDAIKSGRSTPEAAAKSLYTHLQIIEGSIPQSKIISPLSVSKDAIQNVKKKLNDMGLINSKNTQYTNDELKDPALKYFTDKDIELPKVNPNTITIKDNKTNTINKLSEYGVDKINQFTDLKKRYLKEGLSDLKSNGVVYVDQFGVASEKDNGGTETPLNKISKNQLKTVLSNISSTATKKTKEEMFPTE